jgi:hypothetical protein
MVSVLGVLALAVLPCEAQEKPEQLPAPSEKPTLPTEPCCGNKYLWIDYFVPVQTLYAKDFATTEVCNTWIVKEREEFYTVTEMVVEPRDITKEVTYCVTEPVTTTDPATGQTTTCMKEVTHTKKVKERVFETRPVKRKIPYLVPYLAQAPAEIVHHYTIYEWKTDMVKKGCMVSMPGGETANTHQCIVGPKPPCPQEGQAEKEAEKGDRTSRIAGPEPFPRLP